MRLGIGLGLGGLWLVLGSCVSTILCDFRGRSQLTERSPTIFGDIASASANLLYDVTTGRCSKQQLQRVEPVSRRDPTDTLRHVLPGVSGATRQLAHCRPAL